MGKHKAIYTVLAYACLAFAGTISFVLPEGLVENPLITPQHGSIYLTGFARDFAPSQSDFSVMTEAALGQWFNDTTGNAISDRLGVELQRQGAHHVFDDTEDRLYRLRGGFYPLDTRRLGHERLSAHNHYFSFRLDAGFRFEESTDQFITVASTSEVWIFINDHLVIDLGGLHDMQERKSDLNRLHLIDGDPMKVSIFFAQRNNLTPHLRIETNIALKPI